MDMLDAYLRRALLASSVYDVAIESPLDHAPTLSRRWNNEIWLKREDLQPKVFSFKLRGAYHKMASARPETLANGVICASAGNHAQGVALSASRLGVAATIVMPVTTPTIKIVAVENLGGTVVLFGDNYDAAYAHAVELGQASGALFVHPYDDPDVIAGQATVGLEIIKQKRGQFDAIFVAVGGGGLIGGVGAVIRSLRPGVKIIGVEPRDAAAMARSLKSGEREKLDRVGRFADGVAVRQVGEETFRLAKAIKIDEMIVVENDEICAAMKDVFEDRRAILEPAGALSVAGMKRYIEQTGAKGEHLVAIACGANLNFDTLRHVSERAEIGERREAVFAVTIPERPGSFREFCQTIGSLAVTEFNYRYADEKQAHVFVGLRISSPDEALQVAAQLRFRGYDVLDLTDNELAKLHVRHMVGGRAEAANERLTSFSFPERAGALLGFLEAMSHPWNISLFHYRNHGSDYGRVLVGIQVPPEEEAAYFEFLDSVGFEYADETNNPAASLFLR
ncbi:MAG: threonine ammonia-lyase, biosynthetic [Fimbriimonas sp.]